VILNITKKNGNSIIIGKFLWTRCACETDLPLINYCNRVDASIERIISEKESAKVLSSKSQTVKREGREVTRDAARCARLWHRRSRVGHPPNFLPHIMNGQRNPSWALYATACSRSDRLWHMGSAKTANADRSATLTNPLRYSLFLSRSGFMC